jgi:xanthine dehydrogenase molybdopterin-binding subunit B
MSVKEENLSYVGKSTPREDGVAKATGTARFVHDLSLPGMLHAATMKSPYARARILKIDTSEARALPGVRAVLTGNDLDFLLGLYMQDKPILARKQVRYQGEPVAAVAAAIDWGKEGSPSQGEPQKVRGKGIAVLHKAPAMPTFTSCYDWQTVASRFAFMGEMP